MRKSTSRNSASEINAKFRQIFKENTKLLGDLVDARICNNIANDLYELRMQTGLTQQELADKLQVKQSNISRWESPGYQGYKVKVLSKIVRNMGGKLRIIIERPTVTMRGQFDYTNDPYICVIDTNRVQGYSPDQLKAYIQVTDRSTIAYNEENWSRV